MTDSDTLMLTRMEKQSFSVIGKAGSTNDGEGFIA